MPATGATEDEARSARALWSGARVGDAELVVPSGADPFVARMTNAVGGPRGRRAAGGIAWWTPLRVTLLIGLLTWVAGMFFRLPCRITAPGQAPDWFKLMCYTDIPLLYVDRGLQAGNTPYLDSGGYQVLEYPPLTGWFLEFERILAHLLGAAQGTGLSPAVGVKSTLIFWDVNQVLLGALFLVAVWAQTRTVSTRPWDGVLLAAAPSIGAAALINWDMLAVALTATGMLAWARRRPGVAGLLLGLGMAAKLYPVLVLGPLLLLCLRGRRMPEFFTLFSTFTAGWLVANLPVIVLAPQAWQAFWQFNADRSGDLGSIWYVLSLAGHPVPHLNAVSTALLLVLCAVVGALVLLAPQRPRFGAMAYLVVAAFLITNKVYSPQYVVWLLPFLVLARPRWRDWMIFGIGELLYFAGIWWHLGGEISPGNGGPDRFYWLTVIVRIGTELWVAVLVVRDALRPGRDPVRADGSDDPAGGWLDGARDAGWVRRLRGGRPEDRGRSERDDAVTSTTMSSPSATDPR